MKKFDFNLVFLPLKFISYSWSMIMLLIYFSWGLCVDITPLSCVFLLYINLWMLISSRKNMMLLIISFVFLYCNYSIIFANYVVVMDSMFTTVINNKSFIRSFNILTVFHALLVFFVKWDYKNKSNKKSIFVVLSKENRIIEYIVIFLLLPIFFVGFSVPDISGARGNTSPLYEYSVILFIIYFYYCGHKKNNIIIGLLLLLFFSLQNFVFGGRIQGIQFILCAYLMLYMHKIGLIKLSMAVILSFLIFSIIGAVRGEILMGRYDVISIINALRSGGFALDTAYSSYYTSETFVYVYDKMSIEQIVYYFIEFLKSIFLGNSLCPNSVLGSITYNYVPHWFGGILPFYFYFYLGPFGIILSAVFTAFYINLVISVKKNSSDYHKVIVLWVVCTVFRWYLYTPLVLLRGVLITLIICFIFKTIHKYGCLNVFQQKLRFIISTRSLKL